MFDWSDYSQYAQVKKLKKNAVLFRQGDITNGFYYLLHGKAMISLLRDDGYERIIDFVFPGFLIGEQTLDGNASFTTAALVTDSTLYFFSKDHFERMTYEHPEVSEQFVHSIIKKMRMLVDINMILNSPVDVQLAHFLLNLREKKGDNTIHLTQKSVANYIGKSRVSIWSVLKEWKKEGIIEITNQTFILKNAEKMREKIQSIPS
ncbi:Crp/Fnr family transcriptional regulator [Oceanobacillus sp. Castelsardo]|uniref:Crp/Fnr family transcriptional regulator n=1 Tax=Oceanobacillus sp. Castelsardo TaxID=1851204 RepID=UPI0008398F88|nr:Crp/Fnr family transcriptional regulator [Oceanobacillus sp. Castelsardo]